MNVFIDGASRGNPGESAIGFVVHGRSGEEIVRFGRRIGSRTNNYAEYAALVEALEYVLAHRGDLADEGPLTVSSDSQLLVLQMKGTYRVKSGNILPLYQRARELEQELGGAQYRHVKREENKTADWIVNRVLDEKSYRPADRSRGRVPPGGGPEESPGS
jgi:ribonuclease HI